MYYKHKQFNKLFYNNLLTAVLCSASIKLIECFLKGVDLLSLKQGFQLLIN